MNDYNDRMIRTSVAFFQEVMSEDPDMQALMISNDKANVVSGSDLTGRSSDGAL